MKQTGLRVSLLASMALAMLIGMSGCIFPGHDHHDDRDDHDRAPQHDNDHHDNDRHDDDHH